MKIKENKNIMRNPKVWGIALFFLIGAPLIGIPMMTALIGLTVYAWLYFKSDEFIQIKGGITEYINECNGLNEHIENLRASYVDVKKVDYGEAEFKNISKYKYKKKGLNAKFAPNIYDCTRTVCSSAQKQPFKYVCKYFKIDSNEKTLSQFEEILNNFLAAEEGKLLLNSKKTEILTRVKTSIPFIIRTLFAKELDQNLGFEEIAFNKLYFPQFTFRYISAGGNSGTEFTLTLDIPMLERFVMYLDETVKQKKSAAGQRKLMTPSLRQSIKERDGFTCKSCGNSLANEPNLLLEIDHIIPIAKGGLTEEDNLQTLCWKCNRSKGSKIL